MPKQLSFNTPKVASMSTTFPHAVVTDSMVFVSGTPGLDVSTGKVISEDFEEQLRQSFLNIQIILQEAGSDLSKVVKTTIFMVTGNDFAVVSKIYAEFFPNNPPARTTPQVMPFPAGILVSVECIAFV